ncbi:NepR family anti-sigma factor [Bartonella choladocola]
MNNKKVPAPWNFLLTSIFFKVSVFFYTLYKLTDGVIFKGLKMDDGKEKNGSENFGPQDDLLGSNSEIAVKLRQFYTALQEEEIPEKFLDLLEKLDKAEQGSQN